jgi:hypothetical protein
MSIGDLVRRASGIVVLIGLAITFRRQPGLQEIRNVQAIAGWEMVQRKAHIFIRFEAKHYRPADAETSWRLRHALGAMLEAHNLGLLLGPVDTAAVPAGSRDARLNIRLHKLGSGCSPR